jgi:hypothetical protein
MKSYRKCLNLFCSLSAKVFLWLYSNAPPILMGGGEEKKQSLLCVSLVAIMMIQIYTIPQNLNQFLLVLDYNFTPLTLKSQWETLVRYSVGGTTWISKLPRIYPHHSSPFFFSSSSFAFLLSKLFVWF